VLFNHYGCRLRKAFRKANIPYKVSAAAFDRAEIKDLKAGCACWPTTTTRPLCAL
jgi:superfamily I DNA/RNA helicase